MVIVIKKTAKKKEIEKLLNLLTTTGNKKLPKTQKPKLFNAWKYNGILKLKEDPLKIQKQMRNEWK